MTDIQKSIKAVKSDQSILVACRNATGEADMFHVVVQTSQDEADQGVHYELAEKEAIEAGYEKPFLCFDKYEHRNIARQAEHLQCSIPFSFGMQEQKAHGEIHLGELGVFTRLKGYSDYSSQPNFGFVSFLGNPEEPTINVFADLNKDDATHKICLAQAKNENRIAEE